MPTPVPIPSAALAVSADGKEAFVAAADGATLQRVNLDTGATTTMACECGQIVDAALCCGDKLAVADATANELHLVDTATGETTATIPLGETPTSVTAEGDRLYVSLATKVQVLNAATGDVIGEIPLPSPGPVTPADGRLWIPIPSTGMLALVDMETLTVLAEVPVGEEPVSVAVCDRALVADRAGGAVRAVNLETLAVEATIPAEAPSEVGTTADYAFVRTDGTIAILDCVTGEMDCEIVLGSHAEGVAVAPTRLVATTRAGTRVVVIDPQCIEVTPDIASLDRTYGVPGTLIHATGTFPPDTAFVVQVDGVPVEYVVAQINADGSQATFEVPLATPEGDLTIAATRSSEGAVLETGVWIRCTPTPFATVSVEAALANLKAELLAARATPGLSRQARDKIDQAIRHIEKVLELLAKGKLGEALSKFAEALGKLDEAIARGAPVTRQRLALVEVAQYAVHVTLSAVQGRLGADPLVQPAVDAFAAARLALAAGNVGDALEGLADTVDELEGAIAEARKLTIPQQLAVMSPAMSALVEARERFDGRRGTVILTQAQENWWSEAMAALGPGMDGLYDYSATGHMAMGQLSLAFERVRHAVGRLERLIEDGVPIADILKPMLEGLLAALSIGEAQTEANIGAYDETLVRMEGLLAEAAGSLNPNYAETVGKMANATSIVALMTPPPPPPGGWQADVTVLRHSNATGKLPLTCSVGLCKFGVRLSLAGPGVDPSQGFFHLSLRDECNGDVTVVWNEATPPGVHFREKNFFAEPYRAKYKYWCFFGSPNPDVERRDLGVGFEAIGLSIPSVAVGQTGTGFVALLEPQPGAEETVQVTIQNAPGDPGQPPWEAPNLCSEGCVEFSATDPELPGFPGWNEGLGVELPVDGSPVTFWVRGKAPSKMAQGTQAMAWMEFDKAPWSGDSCKPPWWGPCAQVRAGLAEFTVCAIDLDIAGVEDGVEDTQGGHVCLNDDDDNENGAPDLADPGAVGGEDDLETMLVYMAPGALGYVTLEDVSEGVGQVEVWEGANRTDWVELPKTWEASAAPAVLYVEGVKESSGLSDVRLKLSYAFAPGLAGCVDHVRWTVFDVDLDIAGLQEEQEQTAGGIVCLNDDDDDNSGAPDLQGDGPVGNEDDLLALPVQTFPVLGGTLTFNGPSKIRLWRSASKGAANEVPLGQPVPLPVEGIYVEGIETSTSPADVELTVVWDCVFFGASFQCTSAVRLTVVNVEINPAPGQAGTTGDVVPGMLTGGATGTPRKHYVSPQGEGDVVLQAKVTPEAVGFNGVFDWDGGQEAAAGDQRLVSRAAASHNPVSVHRVGTTAPCDLMNVWIVWCEGVAIDVGGGVQFGGINGVTEVATTMDGQLGSGVQAEVAYNCIFQILPQTIITGPDIPDLTEPNTVSTPGALDPHGSDGAPLGGIPGFANKWDVSRRLRTRVINPAGFTLGNMPRRPLNSFSWGPVVPLAPIPDALLATVLPADSVTMPPTAGTAAAGSVSEGGVQTPGDSYPQDPLYGNDNPAQENKDTNPYDGAIMVPGGFGVNVPAADAVAVLASTDLVKRVFADHVGANLQTFEVRTHFQEFARLEINGKWFRISGYVPWRFHFRIQKVGGTWVDDPNNPSTTAGDNEGWSQ